MSEEGDATGAEMGEEAVGGILPLDFFSLARLF
jgi:hypothetical protein